MPQQPNDQRPAEFVRLFMANQRRILAFVATLVPNLSDAEDVVQEAGTVMWEKFDDFEPGSDFRKWAFKIAHFKVLEFHRRQGRKPLTFDESLIEKIADDASELSNEVEAENRRLAECLAELPADNRQLIQQRYYKHAKIKDLAIETGRSVVTIRKRLQKIHAALLACIGRKSRREGGA